MLKQYAALAALTISTTVLAGCQTGPLAESGSRLPVYSTDLAGKAATCDAPAVKLTDGSTTEATITTGGGGWCGISVNRDGAPYGAPLLVEQAKEGKVYVHSVGDFTRIDYLPIRGAKGADAFAVKLVPGNAVIHVKTLIATATAGK